VPQLGLIGRNDAAGVGLHGEIQGWIGQAGPQIRVWSASIVMRQPRPQSFSKMLLGQGDYPIQTLAPGVSRLVFRRANSPSGSARVS
jgi:hypothetical protein